MPPFIALLTNLLLINVALHLSLLLGPTAPAQSPTTASTNYFLFVSCICVAALLAAGTCKKKFKSSWQLFQRIFLGLSLATLTLLGLSYLPNLPCQTPGSADLPAFFFTALLLTFVASLLLFRYTGRIKKKVLIIGKENAPEFVNNHPLVEKIHVKRVEQILQYNDADEVIIYEPIHKDSQLNLLIYLLLKRRLNILFSPAVYADLLSANLANGTLPGFLATFLGKKSDCEEFLIRTLDIIGSILILLLLSPLIALVILILKFSGPVLYKQTRVSKDGAIFILYKFKTMIDGAEKQSGPTLAARDDPRVTKIGRLLRSSRIDELPQLWNVIRGDMSLVGPRPERPYFVKMHRALRGIRLAVKPGLTGLAQIRSLYNLKPTHKIKYDYLYIQKRSLWLNLVLLAKTIPVVLSKKGW